MQWQEIPKNLWVLKPKKEPIGIIHFLGGFLAAVWPHYTYHQLLEPLAEVGYIIIATPYGINVDNHDELAKQILNKFEFVIYALKAEHYLDEDNLPIYGLGHSLGSKLHLLIGCQPCVKRNGNILISFNNHRLKKGIHLFLGLNIDIPEEHEIEHTPSPEATMERIRTKYFIANNLLISFDQDPLDGEQSKTLKKVIMTRANSHVTLQNFKGGHLSLNIPNYSDLKKLIEFIVEWLISTQDKRRHSILIDNPSTA
ncbi:MAG: DUF1350 family protein [Cyanobacteria bacterium P01_F01_bin.143]